MWPIPETLASRCTNMCIRPLSLAVALAALAGTALGAVATTKHNLSVTGPGPIKSPTEKQICIFCHTPHNADPRAPLWNRNLDSAANYTMPSSSTLQATIPQQPDGASKLCLRNPANIPVLTSWTWT